MSNGVNYCPYCGERVEASVRYCPKCGTRIPAIESPTSETARQQPPPKQPVYQ
jgi:tRNA(Ile2) C34 agmatinyltransferase TiaS